MNKIASDPLITVRRENGNLVAHLKPTFGPDGIGIYEQFDPDVLIVDQPTPSKKPRLQKKITTKNSKLQPKTSTQIGNYFMNKVRRKFRINDQTLGR
jgi:hypothetical protein